MYTLNLKYDTWENRICFSVAPPANETEETKAKFFSLIPTAEEIGQKCKLNEDGDMTYLTQVTEMFKQNGFLRIQP